MISKLEFGNLIQSTDIFDKDFTQGICDTQFIACYIDTHNKNLKISGQNGLVINRFEFLEAIVRISNIKFR